RLAVTVSTGSSCKVLGREPGIDNSARIDGINDDGGAIRFVDQPSHSLFHQAAARELQIDATWASAVREFHILAGEKRALPAGQFAQALEDVLYRADAPQHVSLLDFAIEESRVDFR